MKLKVITLNIWHGGRVWDNAVEFLKRENPDILLMQEVFNSHDVSLEQRFRTMDEFAQLFDFKDNDFAPACKTVLPEGNLEIGNAIFSKFPIIKRYEPVFFNAPYTDDYVDKPGNYQNEPRNLQHVVVEVAGTPLDVLNLQGTWDLDGERDSPDRLLMSEAIVDAVKGKQYVVVGGDTNARPNTQTIRNVEQHLVSIFKDELSTTFNTSRKDLEKFPGYATSVVDMLFASPSIKIQEHYCPDVDASDHLPLVAVLELP